MRKSKFVFTPVLILLILSAKPAFAAGICETILQTVRNLVTRTPKAPSQTVAPIKAVPVDPQVVEALAAIEADTEKRPFFDEEKIRAYYLARLEMIPRHEAVLRGFITGQITDSKIASSSIYFLQGAVKQGLYKFSGELWRELFDRAIVQAAHLVQAKATEEVKDTAFIGAGMLEYLFLDPSREDLLREFADSVAKNYASPDLRIGLQAVLEKYWQFPDTDSNRPAYKVFQNVAEHLHRLGKDSSVEVLLLSIVCAGVNHAEEFDRWLSRGGGYHNTYRINSGLEHAAHAADDFVALGISRGELSKDLDLNLVSAILRAMMYQGGSGRRVLGPRITPHEAFNIGGSTREETYNVYDILRAYIIGQNSADMPVIVRQLEAQKK